MGDPRAAGDIVTQGTQLTGIVVRVRNVRPSQQFLVVLTLDRLGHPRRARHSRQQK